MSGTEENPFSSPGADLGSGEAPGKPKLRLRGWVKALAVLEIVGGLIGLGVTALGVGTMAFGEGDPSLRATYGVGFFVGMALYALLVAAGSMLLARDPRGWKLSRVLQACQSFWIVSAPLAYQFFAGPVVGIGIDANGGLGFPLTLACTYTFGVGNAVRGFAAGLNFVAFASFVLLVAPPPIERPRSPNRR